MLKEKEFSTQGFIIWGICALFFLYEFFLRSSLGTFQHSLTHDLNLTSVQYALLSTTLFVILYGVMQIPIGLLIERIGLKYTLLTGCFMCFVSTLMFAYATNYSWALVARMLMGIGASVGFICLLVSVHEWMPHRYSALFIGLSQFIGTLGPMLGAGPLEALIQTSHVSWQLVFKVLSGVGLFLFILITFFVRNRIEQTERYAILKRPIPIHRLLFKLLFRSQVWFIAFFSATIYFVIEYLSENEGRIFLAHKGFHPKFAAYMITISWLGYAFGSPFWGFLSDFIERRKIVMTAAAVLGVVAISLIVFVNNASLLIVAFFLMGVACSGQTVGFAIMGEQFKKEFVPIGFALNNSMITIFMASIAPGIAHMLDIARARPDFSVQHYYSAFSLLILFASVAVILSVTYIKETFCKSAVDLTELILRRP